MSNAPAISRTPLALWGGPECTVVRLGQHWRDQLVETGHRGRGMDVARIASLGIKTVRYPLLWESVAPEAPGRLDFSWIDDRVTEFHRHGIEVIGGLLHHGSGPHYTNLLDPDFAPKFADFAAQVGERYPSIRRWTPINEPLTTARFSALYGHWYPHHRSYRSFLRALVNQCAGIQAAMSALRAVSPHAELLQTEDLGKTYATKPLLGQADHENERRWLSLDLLCGRVIEGHALFEDMLTAGIAAQELEAIARGASPPAMIGINHYLTSERFLDHRPALHPEAEPGGNGRATYVDIDAVRVSGLDTGLAARLGEAWARYRLPLAITEVHHGCTRDEQLRWLAEVMTAAHQVRANGIDLRAVTLWSLFGNMDWRSLLTRAEGHYDPGAYDVRAPTPRSTALAKAAKAYANQQTFDHPVLDSSGWWRRGALGNGGDEQPRPLLVTGARGTLGRALSHICDHRGLAHRLTDRAGLDINDPAAIAAALDRFRPWALINTAGYVRVADAEREPDSCMAVNSDAAELLARACADREIPFVTFSSDLVFDGLAGRAYLEGDSVSPRGVYGWSKAEAERRVTAVGGHSLIIRTSAFFGPWDRHNFAWHVLEGLRQGRTVKASYDVVSPTFVPDLCHAVLDLLIDGETGIWHLANAGSSSWFDYAYALARGAGLDPALIVAEPCQTIRNTTLESTRGWIMRPLEQSIAAYLRDLSREPALPLQTGVQNARPVTAGADMSGATSKWVTRQRIPRGTPWQSDLA